MNKITLGGKVVYDPPSNVPPTFNQFTIFTGASRYGFGEFILKKSDYDAMIAGASSDKIYDLVMSCDAPPNASGSGGSGGVGSGACAAALADAGRKITIKVVVGGARIISDPVTASSGSSAERIVGVSVFDLRCRFNTPITAAYNVQKQGPLYDGSTPKFYESTLNGSSEWTWTAMLTDLEFSAVSSFANLPTWKPRNYIFNGIPIGRVYDEVAADLFYVLGYKWCAQTSDAGAAISAYQPNQMDGQNATLLIQAAKSRIGGDLSFRPDERFPSAYRVTFPRITTDDDTVDPYTNPTYEKTITVNSLGKNGTEPLHCGRYAAAQVSGALVNQSELDAVAADLAPRAYAALASQFGEREYAGLWPFVPDGYIRGVKWINDRNGARTFIRLNNERDFSPLVDMWRANQQAANQMVIGMGSARVATTPSGARTLFTRGGSGGSGGTVPTGSYTGQVLQMTTDNVAAWQFLVAHAIL